MIEMHSWLLQTLQLLYIDFTTFQAYVFYRLLGLQKQTFYGEGTRDCRREGGGLGEKGEWKAVLDCLFGNENEHPETGELRFEMGLRKMI